MPNENLSNFAKDIQDPSTGLDSDLYHAIAPMVSIDDTQKLSPTDSTRINRLRENMRKGLVGLEYLTGLKKNEGDTFYDEHPIQAVTTDILGKSPMLGAGLAAAGVGTNLLRQAKNFKDTEMASMARKGNPGVDVTHPADLLDPSAGAAVRPEHAKIFGDFQGDADRRFKIVDKLNRVDLTDPASLTQRYQGLQDEKNLINAAREQEIKKLTSAHGSQTDPKKAQQLKDHLALIEKQYAENLAQVDGKIKTLISEARQSGGYGHLKNFANLNESLSRAKQKGGLRGSIGEGLHDIQSDNPLVNLLKKLAPGPGQGIADLAQKNNVSGVDREILNQIAGEYFNDPEKLKAFAKTTAQDIADQPSTPAIMRALKRHRLPLAVGAGTALAGTGLYHLIKAIQNQVYSDDKLKDWKKTLLKSRGEFDRAERV
jgi:hypothetical protein